MKVVSHQAWVFYIRANEKIHIISTWRKEALKQDSHPGPAVKHTVALPLRYSRLILTVLIYNMR